MGKMPWNNVMVKIPCKNIFLTYANLVIVNYHAETIICKNTMQNIND